MTISKARGGGLASPEAVNDQRFSEVLRMSETNAGVAGRPTSVATLAGVTTVSSKSWSSKEKLFRLI